MKVIRTSMVFSTKHLARTFFIPHDLAEKKIFFLKNSYLFSLLWQLGLLVPPLGGFQNEAGRFLILKGLCPKGISDPGGLVAITNI